MAKLSKQRASRLEEAKQNILHAQQKQKKTYDKKHAKPECYKIGQLVLKRTLLVGIGKEGSWRLGS